MAINRYRINHRAMKGSTKDQKVLAELKQPDRLLSVILFANTVANYLIATLGTLAFVQVFGDDYLVLQSIVSAFFLLLLAELIPKNFAACYPERLVYIATAIIRPLRSILFPIVIAMKYVNRFVLDFIGNVPVKAIDKHVLTREDIHGVIKMAGGLGAENQDMLKGVLSLDELTVNDILIPRRDLKALDVMMPWAELKKSLGEIESSKIVLYRRNLDNLVGVACKKKLYRALSAGELNRNTLMQLIDPIIYIPEGTAAQVQLKAFRRERYNLGVVVDEYGVLMGVVTLADIVDEVIRGYTGDPVSQKVLQLADGGFEVVGTYPVRDFNHVSGWELPTGGPVTISGLVIETLESLPNGCVCVQIDNYRIEVVAMDEQRIKRVRIYKVINA